MSSLKQIKSAQKAAVQCQQVIGELGSVVKDIARIEKSMTELTTELASVNAKYQGQRTTRQDVEYLSALLECAKKKLKWEKHLASLQKRTPEVLEKMSALLNDPQNPPPDPIRAQMFSSLQSVQEAMERLQAVKP
jgi:hypothetical protein